MRERKPADNGQKSFEGHLKDQRHADNKRRLTGLCRGRFLYRGQPQAPREKVVFRHEGPHGYRTVDAIKASMDELSWEEKAELRQPEFVREIVCWWRRRRRS